MEGLKTAAPLPEVYGASDELERISFGVAASVEQFNTTGEQRYADEAVALDDQVPASQERKLQPWSVPLTGYLYASPERENLFRHFHVGEEQEPIMALIRQCESLPNHNKWMKWCSEFVPHCSIIERQAQFKRPSGRSRSLRKYAMGRGSDT